MIERDVATVFEAWMDFDQLARTLRCVRRIKPIDAQRSLWDLDLVGHQVVWESLTTALVPDESVCWESTWGAVNRGEVRFEPLASSRTRLTLEVEYRPRGFLERFGTHLGLVDRQLRRALGRFRDHMEREERRRGRAPDDARARTHRRHTTATAAGAR